MLIYLAVPVDLVNSPDKLLSNWQDRVRGRVSDRQWSLFEPASAFTVVSGPPTQQIQVINLAALEQCDGLLALLPPGLTTLGVPMEIQRALDLGKPVAVVGAAHSWAIAGSGAFHTQLVEEAVVFLESAPTSGRGMHFAGPGVLPTQAHPGEDAGYDLYTSAPTLVEAGQWKDIPCGISVQLPAGMWGLILGRSSAMRTRRLRVHPGVIDNGYRGELFVLVENIGLDAVKVEEGERVGQLIPLPLTTAMPERVEKLGESSRGSAGFGSSGT